MVCIATLGTARCKGMDVNAGTSSVALGFDAQILSLLRRHLRKQPEPAIARRGFSNFSGR